MKNLTNILIVIFSILIFSTCTKFDFNSFKYKKKREEHRLFRCKIDGEEWTTYVKPEYLSFSGSGLSELTAKFLKGYKGKDLLQIIARKESKDDDGF